MADNFLHGYFLNNSGKRLHKWVHYFDVYQRHFERFRGKSPTIVEIGVFGGGSLEMWKSYFGPGAKIIGVDINPSCKQHESENVEIFIGSQDNPDIINEILEKYPNIDIVLDDGSHIMHHMIATFNLLYHKVNSYGVYMIEDTHTCYSPKYGGGVKVEGSFMEFVKNKMDEINAVHSQGKIPVSDLTRSTDYISCYDSIVVFEKKPQSKRQAPITFGME